MQRAWTAILLVACLVGLAPTAAAASAKNRGLLISPLRSYVSTDAGQAESHTLTVANLTEKPIQVALSVEQFTVADYSYDYRFKPTQLDWIKLGTTQLQLKAQQSRTIPYDIAVPAGTAPGGRYFTILATTTFDSGAVPTKVQAATVLYLTVNGKLDTSSTLVSSSIPKVSLGKEIPFSLTVKNKGNTHFFVHASGTLTGMHTQRQSKQDSTHLLLPNSVRIVGNTIPAPLLPGVYRATYGYQTENGRNVQQSRYLLYIPPWSLILPICLLLLGVGVRKHKRYRLQRRH
ncbi:MAG TPA: hypothetical protein VMY99_01935 [Nevskiaceae bacterium]|nr:hypothetical protein [Nevskiaceae bacterium]